MPVRRDLVLTHTGRVLYYNYYFIPFSRTPKYLNRYKLLIRVRNILRNLKILLPIGTRARKLEFII